MNKLITTLASVLIFVFSINTYSSFEYVGGVSGKITALIINGQDLYAGIENGGVRLSSNNGDTWNDITNNLGQITVNRFAVLGSSVFAATETGVYRTTNRGVSWQLMNNGMITGANTVRSFNNELYAGNSYGEVYKSINSGDSWALLWNGIFTGGVNDVLYANNNFFVACNDIFITTNNGVNWNSENPPGSKIFVLHASGNVIRAGGSGGFKNTTPNGGFVYEQPWGNYTYAFGIVGNFIMHAGMVGIFWSPDNGVTWHDPGYPFLWTNNVYSMAQNGDYVFAGATNGVYRKSTSSFTGVSQIGTSIPEKFSLSQNYPNPFNPETNIKFGLPKTSGVTLIVYNQLGQSVAELVNQKLVAGTYEYNFNSTGLSSGVYYYKLISEEYSDTRKMILVK
jgi:hypothetical protein